MRRLVVMMVIALASALAPGPAAAGGMDARTVCARAAQQAEALAPSLPDHLLTAIAKVETGRGDGPWADRHAWPWTINVDGDGRYYRSKQAAIAAVKRLREEGAGNIDVGCMQISLRYHGDAFESLAEAFDPARNVAYAAAFLLKLHAKTKSWMEAIGDYHSRRRGESVPYRGKVLTVWNAERRAHYANAEHRTDESGA